MITIDYMNKKPIYEQIADKIDELVLIDYYKSGEQLPTVKQLAFELSINPNTIQRAYAELENRGTIVTVKGKGCYISNDAGKIKNRKQNAMLTEFTENAKKMMRSGITAEQLIKCVNDAVSEKYEEANHD